MVSSQHVMLKFRIYMLGQANATTHLNMEFKSPSLPEALLRRDNNEEIVKRAGVFKLDFAVLRLVLLHLLHFLHQQLVPDAHPAHTLPMSDTCSNKEKNHDTKQSATPQVQSATAVSKQCLKVQIYVLPPQKR